MSRRGPRLAAVEVPVPVLPAISDFSSPTMLCVSPPLAELAMVEESASVTMPL